MTAIPEGFDWDGPVKAHPMLQRDKFHLWLQAEREDRVPFPLLPMPTPAEMQQLLEDAGWDERQASVRFQVPVNVIRGWLSGGLTPQNHQFEWTRLGARAAWTALAYATGAAPATKGRGERGTA